jgi:hypothetical protein
MKWIKVIYFFSLYTFLVTFVFKESAAFYFGYWNLGIFLLITLKFFLLKILRFPVYQINYGFGPDVFKIRVGNLIYRLKAIPAFGMVKWQDNAPERSLKHSILSLIINPLAGLIALMIITSVSYKLSGIPIRLGSLRIAEIKDDTLLKSAGAASGDYLTRIQKIRVNNLQLIINSYSNYLDLDSLVIEFMRGDSLIYTSPLKITREDLAKPEPLGLKIEIEPKIEVTAINPNSNASKIGLKAGDIIMGVTDKRTTDVYSFLEMLKENKGKEIQLTIQRFDEVFVTPKFLYEGGGKQVRNLGAYVQDMGSSSTGISNREEVEVIYVFPNSPGDSAGLKPGMIITKAAGKNFRGNIGLRNVIMEHAGKEIEIQVRDGNQERTLKGTPRINPPQGQGALGFIMPVDHITLKVNMWQALQYGFYQAVYISAIAVLFPSKLVAVLFRLPTPIASPTWSWSIGGSFIALNLRIMIVGLLWMLSIEIIYQLYFLSQLICRKLFNTGTNFVKAAVAILTYVLALGILIIIDNNYIRIAEILYFKFDSLKLLLSSWRL